MVLVHGEEPRNRRHIKNILLSFQKRASIRITKAYGTTSTKALLVEVRNPSRNLMVEERIMAENKEVKDKAPVFI